MELRWRGKRRILQGEFRRRQASIATDADSGEIGIRLDEFANVQEIGLCAFVPCRIIRLIEWRHTLYGESFLLGIFHGGLDNAVPLLRLALVVGCIERLMVAVDFHRSGSRKLDMGDAGIEGSFLGCRKLAILPHQVARLERNSTRRNQILADILQKFTKEWLDIFQNQYFFVYLQQLSTN